MFSEIDNKLFTFAKVKDKYDIDVHSEKEHGPPHGHLYTIENGERGRDIGRFYLRVDPH